MELSEIIKRRRTDLDITLKSIADKVGVSEATVQRYESGNIKNLRHNKITKLAEALRLSPCVLMGWEEYPDCSNTQKEIYITKEARAVAVLYDKADDRDRAIVLNVLERYEDKKKKVLSAKNTEKSEYSEELIIAAENLLFEVNAEKGEQSVSPDTKDA